MASLKKQALILTLANAYTRALGFVLRLTTARMMGAQALGLMELSSSAVMLAITPVTAGVPTAMSRLAAQKDIDPPAVLRAGLSLIRRLTLVLAPAMLLLSPAIAWVLGDMRTLPSLLASVPLIGLLGVCAVYSGYFYGRDDAATPALSECAEQPVRFSCHSGGRTGRWRPRRKGRSGAGTPAAVPRSGRAGRSGRGVRRWWGRSGG